MAEHAASCEGVVRIYWSPGGEVHALKGVDAVLPAGSLTALTGPSGSGKTSLLKILAAQDRPTAGLAVVAGEPLTALSGRRLRALRRRHIGYVFARPPDNLQPELTVVGHLREAGRLRGLPRPVVRQETEELVGLLGLTERADHRPDQLSGGEQQRLAFAQAVVGSPALVVADEPTGELDSATTADLLGVVRRLAHRGTTVLVATHDPQAAEVADQVLAMRSGTIAAEQVAGRRLAVIDGNGRLQLPDEVLRRFHTRRVEIDVDESGVHLREPS
ncbi:putative ABC transport system ATP-binding protein [Motilibacter peucedani]|uniref:Putative ABC transport system ATP-binding protein n=1 Tax=Motilibacter peucedani TaxID=598650 RepID=A0A420XPL6_9ACTN|nr:ATP-binding cassette domain-containing protein [Motilibacter peucedani]RKS74124.1 putative ABC transport system ATP-binding protein [Motilibacter peucedani]